MKGQITIKEYMESKRKVFPTCSDCVCQKCLFWRSHRCPYGKCFDDYRAKHEPYDAAHPDKPPRTQWSNWNKPGEQAHWCRGGTLYPVWYCKHFKKYKGQQVQTCIKAQISVFQDGYIECPLVENFGCEACYRELKERKNPTSYT